MFIFLPGISNVCNNVLKLHLPPTEMLPRLWNCAIHCSLLIMLPLNKASLATCSPSHTDPKRKKKKNRISFAWTPHWEISLEIQGLVWWIEISIWLQALQDPLDTKHNHFLSPPHTILMSTCASPRCHSLGLPKQLLPSLGQFPS